MQDYDEARDVVLDRAFETPDLDYLLEASAGTKDGVRFHRPYYVAAVLWSTVRNTRRFQSGDGANFDRVQDTIAGLMAQQAAADTGVTIPVGYAVVVPGGASVPGPVFTGWQ